jgi:hypothetical protein
METMMNWKDDRTMEVAETGSVSDGSEGITPEGDLDSARLNQPASGNLRDDDATVPNLKSELLNSRFVGFHPFDTAFLSWSEAGHTTLTAHNDEL